MAVRRSKIENDTQGNGNGNGNGNGENTVAEAWMALLDFGGSGVWRSCHEQSGRNGVFRTWNLFGLRWDWEKRDGTHITLARWMNFYRAHEEKNGRHDLGVIERSSLSNRISFPLSLIHI